LTRASLERRALTLEEKTEINRLQGEIRTEAIKILSENETQAKVILERMKEYDKRMTAEQMSEHITTLNEGRDKAVETAKDQYEKTLAEIIRMRDDSKTISAEKAERMIEDAKYQRDEIIKKAEDTRIGAIDNMREMNKDLDKMVNTQTGKIITVWDELKRWWSGWKPETKAFEYTVKQAGTIIAGGLVGTAQKVAAAGKIDTDKKEYQAQESQFYNVNKDAIAEIARQMNVDMGVATSMYKHEQEQSGNVNITQNIYAPVSSPAEMAREAKKAQQELALEF